MTKIYYFDNAATTCMSELAIERYAEVARTYIGNPSSLHQEGVKAKALLEELRDECARHLDVPSSSITFTSGGTESNAIVINNTLWKPQKAEIILTNIEHPSIKGYGTFFRQLGWKVIYLDAPQGFVRPSDLAKALTGKTRLVCSLLVNNVVGSIQDIAALVDVVRKKEKSTGRKIHFHTDAVQAIGSIPIDVNDLNVDLLSLSAHKFYGPNGVGALYIRKGVKIGPYIHGGAQERNKRAGTENLAGIIGLGKAIELAVENMEKNNKKLIGMRDRLIKEIMSKVEYTRLNGHPEKRLPGNVNLSFEFIEGEALLLSLDLKGIAGSSGSACTSGSLDPSHVLLAIGLSHEIAHGSLRLTLGDDNTDQEIDYVIEVLPEIVNRLREMSPLFAQDKGGLEYV